MKIFFSLVAMLLFSGVLYAHGISEADKQAMLNGEIWLGATHMLTGYDHLLFLFGVIFFLNNFKRCSKICNYLYNRALYNTNICYILRNTSKLLFNRCSYSTSIILKGLVYLETELF